MGDLLRLSPWSGGLGWTLVIRVLLWVLLPCFCERGKTVAATCTLYFSLIIMKSLQLRGCRQIAEPRKYCLVRVIIFFNVCFFYFFVFHGLRIRVNSPHFQSCGASWVPQLALIITQLALIISTWFHKSSFFQFPSQVQTDRPVRETKNYIVKEEDKKFNKHFV